MHTTCRETLQDIIFITTFWNPRKKIASFNCVFLWTTIYITTNGESIFSESALTMLDVCGEAFYRLSYMSPISCQFHFHSNNTYLVDLKLSRFGQHPSYLLMIKHHWKNFRNDWEIRGKEKKTDHSCMYGFWLFGLRPSQVQWFF